MLALAKTLVASVGFDTEESTSTENDIKSSIDHYKREREMTFALKILQGRNLVAMDYNFASRDSSDPYCVVHIPSTTTTTTTTRSSSQDNNNNNDVGPKQIGRTPVERQTLNPIWGGDQSTFKFVGTLETPIMIDLFDFDNFKSDDAMGQVRFTVREITEMMMKETTEGYPNVWFPVHPCEDADKVSGMIEVRMLRIQDEWMGGVPLTVSSSSLEEGNGLCCDFNRVRKGSSASKERKPPSLSTTFTKSLSSSETDDDFEKQGYKRLSAGPRVRGGTSKGAIFKMISTAKTPVTLHVYDVGHNTKIKRLNRVSAATGAGGIFHAAIEINSREYSFGGSRHNISGIFACPPRKCPMHHHKESIYLGDCELSPKQVNAIIKKLEPQWMAPTYDLFRKNCCFFAKEFAVELGVGSIPEWVYSLAVLGAKIDTMMKKRDAKMKKVARKKKEKEIAKENLKKEKEQRKKEKEQRKKEKKEEKKRLKRLKHKPVPEVRPLTPCLTPAPSEEEDLDDENLHSAEFEMELCEPNEDDADNDYDDYDDDEITIKIHDQYRRSVLILSTNSKEDKTNDNEDQDKKEADGANDMVEDSTLDQVMAYRVQRAFRKSLAIRKIRASIQAKTVKSQAKLANDQTVDHQQDQSPNDETKGSTTTHVVVDETIPQPSALCCAV